MNGITFNKQNGGLARKQSGLTSISGLVVYGEANVGKQVVFSTEELIGITASSHPVTHYHVSEFYRVNPGAKLYIESVATSDGNYTDVKTLQSFAEGSIRQIAVCDFKAPVSSIATRVAKLEQIATEFFTAKTPALLFLSMKVVSADMTSLTDLHTLNAPNVSVVLGQDAGGLGAYLHTANPSLSNIGSVLGAKSRAEVHESIAWVEKQNLVSTGYAKSLTGGTEKARELDVLGFCDGSKLGDYTAGQIESIHNKGYLFGIKQIGIAGSYLNDSFTCTSLADDYAFGENVSVINEVIRELQSVLIPKISGPIYVDAENGELDAVNASVLEGFCDNVLDGFVGKGNISGGSVLIAPGQKVLSTSSLSIALKVIPVGSLREIIVNVGLALKK